jgi:hypothetical protein
MEGFRFAVGEVWKCCQNNAPWPESRTLREVRQIDIAEKPAFRTQSRFEIQPIRLLATLLTQTREKNRNENPRSLAPFDFGRARRGDLVLPFSGFKAVPCTAGFRPRRRSGGLPRRLPGNCRLETGTRIRRHFGPFAEVRRNFRYHDSLRS